jgi:hypothetical protein
MPTFVGNSLYHHANGGCYRCNRGDRLVDMDAMIVGEGSLVLCAGCIGEAAEAAGLTFNASYVSEIQQAWAEERRSFGPERVAELEAKLAETEAALKVANEVDEHLSAIAQAARGRPVNRRPNR